MRSSLAVIALMIASGPAWGEVVLTAIDNSPPDTSCDEWTGTTPLRIRNCYVPELGAPYAPSHSSPTFNVSFTLVAPTVIDAEYHQVGFVSTIYGPTPEYGIAIGVDGFTPCGVAPGIPADSPLSTGVDLTARCVVTLQPGRHTIYALESARQGAFSYRGAENQLLVVRY